MKLTEKIAQKSGPFYTFEFFPPRTDQGFTNLVGRIERLSELNPLAISVTWGAGGSTRDRSLNLAGLCQKEHNVDVVLHLTCTNMQPGLVDDALRSAKERGIQNILALRGDPPRGEEYWIPSDSRFARAADLVAYIKSSEEFRDSFCVGVAGYPDGHSDSLDDEQTQIQHLKAKVDAGAEFIVTQLFYDADGFLKWQAKVREAGISVPILPGIMPLQSYASFTRLTKLCGTRVPPELMSAINPIKHDDQKVKDLGVEVAVSIIKRLHEAGVPGFHICTLNLEKSVQLVLEKLNWVSHHEEQRNQLITESPTLRPQRTLPAGLVITPFDANASASTSLEKQHPGSGPTNAAGKGEMNSLSTWDEFPNGRFGDYKSPAFGVSDLWDNGLSIQPSQGIQRWGKPAVIEDITNLFLSYLEGKIPNTPWSDEPLSPESLPVLKHLVEINKRGWWTVGSQPAVDAVSSEDEVFGWGPKGGYVFQKAFVEFFATKDDVLALETKINKEGRPWVTFFAANMLDDYLTNMSEEGSNAVTWGVFPGQEISSSTIIERDSFMAWKDEAFGYWTEWSLFYPPESKERQLLDRMRDERWLISIVHHNFKDENALWTFLLSS